MEQLAGVHHGVATSYPGPWYEVALSLIAPYFIILLCPMPGEFTDQGEGAGA